MKDMNAREISTDMNNTLGAGRLGSSTVLKYFREKSFFNPIIATDFKPKMEEANSLMKQCLGLSRNALFPRFAILPKEYSFQ
jgi:hypothetical protein